MFDKVRNQFVWTIMAIISTIMIISFAAIYTSASISLNKQVDSQPSIRSQGLVPGEGVVSFFQKQREEYARRALGELLATLLMAGAMTLGVVYALSRYIANRAIAPIEEAYNKQRQFVADASHELKTPITIIGANVDAAMADSQGPSKWLENIQAEVEHTGKLVTDLLSLATLDAGQSDAARQWFDASEVCRDVVEQCRILSDEKDLELTIKIADALPAYGDAERLRQVLTILVDNAIKHTKKGQEIGISAVRKNNQTEISVSNTHARIPKDELSRLFGRFYQSDDSHSKKGHGLGLAIAKKTADTMGWTLAAKSGNKNVTFMLSIPRQ